MISPRQVPTRDEKYMGLAFMLCGFSKDPNTQIGAFILNSEGVPLGFGYNGPPGSMNDNEIDWSRPAKYDYIIHAEQNAIDHTCNRDQLNGAVVYVTAFPCKVCMLEMTRWKISEVIYYPYKPKDKSSMLCSNTDRIEDIARKGGVKLTEFSGNLSWLKDHIMKLEAMDIFAL